MGDQIAITETRTAVLATENAELDAMAQPECKPTTRLEEATISSTPTGMSLRDQIALIVEETKILDSQVEEQKKGFLKGVTLRQQIKLLDEQSSVLKRRVEDQGRDVVRMGIQAVKERRTEEFVQEVRGGKGKKNLKSVQWEEGATVQDGEKVAVDHDGGGSKVMNRRNFYLQRKQGLRDGYVAGLGFAAVAIAVALTWKFVVVK